MKTVIVIAGATATGKTGLSVQLAKHLQTEIISADSRQCYREMKIGVARPSELELHEVPHHFIASHSIHEKFTAADFESYALSLSQKLFQKHENIVLTGGTGLYINAFCDGLDEIPEVPEGIREEIQNIYNREGIVWLQEEIKKHDPAFFATGEIQNPHRLIRALEVFRATGQPITSFRKGSSAPRPFNVIRFALEVPREELYRRINDRVDQMIADGLEEEARSLMSYQQLNALQTVGYRELFSYFNGEITREEAIEKIKQHTRQYAKRQMTWFRKDQRYTWVKPGIENLKTHLQELA